ncbi:transcriptional regulator [Veronia nyctiphanis]|uniref:Transcriptional regulator n=1 Tax=Veronia nyctiphanis TaxID=1278244 RepID=A0A4Q0YTI2_9GAMM|nr:LysR family transcriptional regulator [Veronia nyctiphanis]RXJ74025.1 transcriptional regulator [Veronia nyctiphanis]
MDFKLLEDFVCLAHASSFTAAARERFVTQPAFSRRIRSLEQWVGTSLVNRDSQNLELTDQGKAFVTEAEAILDKLYTAREMARSVKSYDGHEVSVAAQNSIVQTLFMRWMREIEKEVGPIYVRLSSDRLADSIDLFSRGLVDYLMCYTRDGIGVSIDTERYQSTVIGNEILVPVSSCGQGGPQYQLPGEPDNPIPLVGYSHQTLFGKAIDQLLVKHACFLDRRYENPFSHTLKSMVQAGYGIAWLPMSFIKDEVKRGELYLAGSERWHISFQITIYYRETDDPLSQSIIAVSKKMAQHATRETDIVLPCSKVTET